MRLLLVNPSNPLVSIVRLKDSRWNRYRVWQPLSLMALAGLTPPEWEVTVADENILVPRYDEMPRPDLVGVTAFTSQAPRAYDIAAQFRRLGVPVVMGGIHATMCVDEAMRQVDSVVTGEADTVWPQVLADAAAGCMNARYDGGLADMDAVRPARHDLLTGDYAFGAIQTTRGCPMNCTFCSVTAFNGARYRQRRIPDVVREFASIREKRILVVDDNLIGTRSDHLARAKDLFRALAAADLGKEWVAQATINFADDEELLALAARAGCRASSSGSSRRRRRGSPRSVNDSTCSRGGTWPHRWPGSSAIISTSSARSSSGWTPTLPASASAPPRPPAATGWTTSTPCS